MKFKNNRLLNIQSVSYDIPVIRVEPSKGWVSLKLKELWEYRELLYFLT